MLPLFLPLLLATCANGFTNSAIVQEDRHAVHPKYHWESSLISIFYDGKGLNSLYEAVLQQITTSTCIRFQKLKPNQLDNKNYLSFEWNPESDCNSVDVKEQTCKCKRRFSIGGNCATTQKVIVTLLRGLGIHFQHTRLDRAEHVVVAASAEGMHAIRKSSQTFGLPFDPLSIMHPFTEAALKTVTYKDKVTQLIAGKAKRLSFYDKKELNIMFHCGDQCSSALPACLNEGYRLQTDNCECQCRKGFWGSRCENNKNSHHLYNIFTMDQAKEVVTHIEDTIASSFNALVASKAVLTVKQILSGNTPTMLFEEEVESRDVFAITLGKLSLDHWGQEAVVKLGGKPGQKLGDVLKGHLPDIINTVTKNGGHEVVGNAFGHTMGIHFARSLGRGAVCVVKKLGKDIVNGVKWVGGKLKSGCKAVYNTLKNAPSKLYHKLASFFHFW